MINIHATCVAFGRFGILIRGPSGSGKSSLALRVIDGEGFGIGETKLKAKLVADDQVMVERKGLSILARPPAALAGKLEIRGIGIVRVDHMKSCQLRLVIDLAETNAIVRLPEATDAEIELLSLTLPRLVLDGRCADAAAKLRAAIAHVKRNNTF